MGKLAALHSKLVRVKIVGILRSFSRLIVHCQIHQRFLLLKFCAVWYKITYIIE